MLIPLVVISLVVIGVVAWRLSRKNRPKAPDLAKPSEPTFPPSEAQPLKLVKEREPEPEPIPAPVPSKAAPLRLSDKLGRTRGALFGRLSKLLGGEFAADWEAKQWEELEEVLLEADVGVKTTFQILDRVKVRAKETKQKNIRDLVRDECQELLVKGPTGFPEIANVPYVISIVGINGVGKTTTTGKLAFLLKQSGKSVLLGAADTFRAAAIAQLKVWAERADVQIVTGREGADPGAVAFDALTAAKARGIDVVLIDTAGRLHNKTSLMDELKKVDRVMKKVIPEAPHETWLVLDGTLGQNSVQQAKEFQKALELTGVIITKLDGTAKGGAILSVVSELGLPVRFIGVGESIEDFLTFSPGDFVEAILGDSAQ